MIEGRFIFEISPDRVLLCEGPWSLSSQEAEWEISIMPFKPLSLDSPRFLNAKRSRIIRREDLSQCGEGELPSTLSWTNSKREDFSQSFQQLQALITSNEAKKGVPWASQSAPYKGATLLWEKLLSQAPHLGRELVVYGAELENESVLGASPEWLFHIEAGGKTLHTMALAGTRWTNQERPDWQEKKDAQEHELVVEDIVEMLSPFGVVERGDRHWFTAGSVEHLRSSIRLVSKTKLDPSEILKVLHPTPAVGVFPRTEKAKNWLYSLPGFDERKDFAAPWVVHHRPSGEVWAIVALRQIRMRADHLFIPAGCGVIADSVEEVEWREIQEKINSVKKAWKLPG
ncbi:MAG: chorismate-binding protein [Bacteriovoracaceae bacterium]|nr:chorismate-binding protein [Bacteriovoracaceae bacterium]